jgi:hypothetical protein
MMDFDVFSNERKLTNDRSQFSITIMARHQQTGSVFVSKAMNRDDATSAAAAILDMQNAARRCASFQEAEGQLNEQFSVRFSQLLSVNPEESDGGRLPSQD